MLQGGFSHGQPKGGDTSRLCYSCDAKWSRGHVCEGPKLFLIEEVLTDEIEENDEATLVETVEEEPEISLNAITGTPTPKTMRLLGRLLNHKVIVVIDSGRHTILWMCTWLICLESNLKDRRPLRSGSPMAKKSLAQARVVLPL
jgi:hypothetical protein